RDTRRGFAAAAPGLRCISKSARQGASLIPSYLSFRQAPAPASSWPLFPHQLDDRIRDRLRRLRCPLLRTWRWRGTHRYALGHLSTFQIAVEFTPAIALLVVCLDIGPCSVEGRELSVNILLLIIGEFASGAVSVYIDQDLTWLGHVIHRVRRISVVVASVLG